MSLIHTFCFWLASSASLPPWYPACPHLPVIFLGWWEQRELSWWEEAALWLGSLWITFAEYLAKRNGENPKRMLQRSVSVPVSQMLWSSCFWGINYLLAHFSKLNYFFFLVLSFIFFPCSYAYSFILVTEEYWDGKLLSLPILDFASWCYCCICNNPISFSSVYTSRAELLLR